MVVEASQVLSLLMALPPALLPGDDQVARIMVDHTEQR
jgi:hypothetical protein